MMHEVDVEDEYGVDDTVDDEYQQHERQFHSSTPIRSSQRSKRDSAVINNNHNNYNDTLYYTSQQHAASMLQPRFPPKSPASLKEQIKELQLNFSKLALENEELKSELHQFRLDFEELRNENEMLCQTNRVLNEQNKRNEAIQVKMGEKLESVSQTVYNVCERLRALKSRYYEEQRANAWMAHADEK